jgi:hypothetical protein
MTIDRSQVALLICGTAGAPDTGFAGRPPAPGAASPHTYTELTTGVTAATASNATARRPLGCVDVLIYHRDIRR